jgi:hypothetical protein
MSWETERQFGDRHEAVKRLEAAAQLQPPNGTPGSTPAVLTFRTIARILAALQNERKPWDGRSQWLDTSGYGAGPRFDLSAFPSAQAALREQRPTDLFGRPEYRFWVLLRGGEGVAVLDTDGRVHLTSGERSLPDAYVKAGHRLTSTIAATLGDVLPGLGANPRDALQSAVRETAIAGDVEAATVTVRIVTAYPFQRSRHRLLGAQGTECDGSLSLSREVAACHPDAHDSLRRAPLGACTPHSRSDPRTRARQRHAGVLEPYGPSAG